MQNDTENPCGYCKNKDSAVLYPTYDIFGKNYHINQCQNCNAYFLSPHPSPEELARAYDTSYYGVGEEKFNEGWIEKMLDYFRGKRADIIKNHLGEKGKVLDIGCGNGRFLSFVKDRGNFEIFGIEPEGGSAKRAADIKGINLKIGFLEENDFESESLNAITLFHVFEHLTEPKATLEIIQKILKRGGILVMSFPNIGSWQAQIFKGKWFHMDPPRHLFFFATKDFKQLMTELGFELIREKHFSIEYNPYGTQQSILNMFHKKREALYELLKGNKEYVKEYSKFNLFMQQLFFKLTGPIFIVLDAIESTFKKGGTVEFAFRKK
ncbi:MAG: hypothetical protein COA57_01705 [Flavobacteriales bacterium]|nr:MAG: hypothetical protein COA57_01705 [Flavobacteriales bacterium]